MSYTKDLMHTEWKRPRLYLGSIEDTTQIPNLIEKPLESYRKCLQLGVKRNQLKDVGLHSAIKSIFPIKSASGHIVIDYIDYTIGECAFDVQECRIRGLSYAGVLRALIRVTVYDRDGNGKPSTIKEVKEQDVYLGEIPLMTETGSFIINGTERIVVSQLHRSPGVFFEHDKGKSHSSGKLLYSARIIPYRGAWLDFEFDIKDCIFARIDRRRKMPVTVIFKAMGYSNDKILDMFYEKEAISINHKSNTYKINCIPSRLTGSISPIQILDGDKVIVDVNQRISNRHIRLIEKANITVLEYPKTSLLGKILATDIIDQVTGEILAPVNSEIDETLLAKLTLEKIEHIEILYINEVDHGSYISQSLRIDGTDSKFAALVEIYKVMRPGEPPTEEAASALFDSLFFSEDRYDLSPVGRMKLNKRLGMADNDYPGVLSPEDIINVVKMLVDIRDGRGLIDDIDNLGNRRIRSVGEMVENQIRIGLTRVERGIRDRLAHPDIEGLSPQEYMNAKTFISSIREFFGSSQLSQFLEETNPLSKITHARRISALGPGGLTRDRAGFDVRDVHPTHYSRLCPIETPEGPNIGLINTLAVLARVNDYGFLEAPFKVVKDGRITDEIAYLSAIEEGNYRIASASVPVNAGKITGEFVPCRFQRDIDLAEPTQIDFVDVSSKQIVSVAASLIPFLEHDDANRALMGSNMQRQAVPTLCAQKPLVGTGMESVVASDSGASQTAVRDGVVKTVHSDRIVVETHDEETGEKDVDIYSLVKFSRSNQNTAINQRPIIEPGVKVQRGEILADGASIDLGELALGQNMLVAFMSWNGYNFEDSIIISERVVKEERLTTVHIQELTCIARDTKLGAEEITADIPNIGESALKKLDESGIVYTGAKVKPGDILVGKVTPKGESHLTPEEKLLRAIFGEKASDVKDSSLRVPPGTDGTVIDVQVFTRDGADIDQRAKAIQAESLAKAKKNLKERYDIAVEVISGNLKNAIIGKELTGLKGEKGKVTVTESLFDSHPLISWLQTESKDDAVAEAIEKYHRKFQEVTNDFEEKVKLKRSQIEMGDDLSPGVIKVVKVFVACKRKIQPGDKLAGRHGNKGVISIIVPEEDMPYMADGTPVDVILNPLGVPSRMNVGQILETHLGWAAKGMGQKLTRILQTQGRKEALEYVKTIYNLAPQKSYNFDHYDEKMQDVLFEQLGKGVPCAAPVFDGPHEDLVRQLLKVADLPESGQTQLYDGRTGRPFDRKTTVGYMYILKLNHLVDDKMHARSTGSYSLVTQQPLGGKAQFGGQRFGEMEVWALQAYGAAYTLQEMLTVKSDDVAGRTRMYKNIVDGNYTMNAGIPESFKVLTKEIRALGIDVVLEDE